MRQPIIQHHWFVENDAVENDDDDGGEEVFSVAMKTLWIVFFFFVFMKVLENMAGRRVSACFASSDIGNWHVTLVLMYSGLVYVNNHSRTTSCTIVFFLQKNGVILKLQVRSYQSVFGQMYTMTIH